MECNACADNEVGDDGATELARALQKNTTFTDVSLIGPYYILLLFGYANSLLCTSCKAPFKSACAAATRYGNRARRGD